MEGTGDNFLLLGSQKCFELVYEFELVWMRYLQVSPMREVVQWSLSRIKSNCLDAASICK